VPCCRSTDPGYPARGIVLGKKRGDVLFREKKKRGNACGNEEKGEFNGVSRKTMPE